MDEAFSRALETAQTWVGEDGVVAVGEGESEGRPTIDVWVTSTDAADRFPPEVEGFEVRIRESGGEIGASTPDE